MGGPRSLAMRPNGLVVWVGASRGDSVVTLRIDGPTGTLTPTAGPGWLRATPDLDGVPRGAGARRPARARGQRRRGACLRGQRAESDGVAVLGPQLAPNCLPVRAKTIANQPNSVVLACSDPNGDKIALTIVRQPRHGRVNGLVKATGTITYRPVLGYVGSDSFTYSATDGLDVSVAGTATVSVMLPPRAPRVSIRTVRTRLLTGAHIHVLVDCPAIAIGPCRVAAHLLVKGRSAGYGFSKLAHQTTGRVNIRTLGVEGAHAGAGRGHGTRPLEARDDRQADDPDREVVAQASTAAYSVTGGQVHDEVAVAVCACRCGAPAASTSCAAGRAGIHRLLARVRRADHSPISIAAVCGALRSGLSSAGHSPAATRSISPRMAIIASKKRSSSAMSSDSVGSTISVPATGKHIVGAWKP